MALIDPRSTYAVRKSGMCPGEFVLIDRDTFDLVDMSFDDESSAEKFATDRFATIDNSSLD